MPKLVREIISGEKKFTASIAKITVATLLAIDFVTPTRGPEPDSLLRGTQEICPC